MSMTQYVAWEHRGVLDIGCGSISQIGAHFKAMGSRRIGIITDKGLVNAGVVDMVKDVIEVQGAPVVAGVYDKIGQDAKSLIINECLRWCGENGVEGLLAIGGGSVLDTVKGVKIMLGFGVRDIAEIMRATAGIHTGLVIQPLTFPHIAVPTTAGTGAESSPGAVILVEEEGLKGNIMHPHLPAQVAVLDPQVTVSLPPRMTAETGCDALSHCIEAFFARNANSLSDAFAIHAIKLIKKYLPVAVGDGKNIEARMQMLIASNMGMQAYSKANGSAPIHNFAHAIGPKLNIPHGLANAVLMSHVMSILFPLYLPRICEFADAFGVKTDGLSPEQTYGVTVAAIEDFKKQLGIPAVFPHKLTPEDKADLRFRVKTDIAGFRFPLPVEVVDIILDLSFSK
ncbi:MAG: alcohol dehydrogenase [Deltaproteobacteria bacterium HGW-Deltaproteobacteria-12]|jgi:alcohol dehydrogenase class IV|nr:MAG: alcohol dehydrogenase [Deltaproteobacteria bacterium HGW-Deltaproteobacteria-12]